MSHAMPDCGAWQRIGVEVIILVTSGRNGVV